MTDNTDNNEEKYNLNENMLTEYGDDGDNDTSNIYCEFNVCFPTATFDVKYVSV